MASQPHVGMNRTGIATSPIDSKKLLDAENALNSDIVGDPAELVEIKTMSILEADSLGSVPPPVSVKGVIKTGMKALAGEKPQVFLDKLAERAAFERGGTRLYDALILKFQMSTKDHSGATLEALTQIRSEELAHFHLLCDAIQSLGGDPTAQTPSADLAGVEAMGLMQVLNDPRTTFVDGLNAMLTAELTDVDAWDLLAELADVLGEDDLAASFRRALQDEQRHLEQVRTWYQGSVKQMMS